MRALDLFCGAGGASQGLANAGFDEVWGYDIKRQPRYPYRFVKGDATQVPLSVLRTFDFIWASPPCQKHTAMNTMHNAKPHVCFIEPTRDLLQRAGVPYAIENVEGAPLLNPVTMCATSFMGGIAASPKMELMELQRHRLIETSGWPLPALPCVHRFPVLGVYGGHVRDRRRGSWENNAERGYPDPPLALAQRLMGINWMTLNEMCEAVPPYYSEYVARQWMKRP